MTTPAAPSISVRGGSGGITADCDSLRSAADSLAAIGVEAARLALSLHHVLFAPELVVPSILDPAGGARFEFELAAALDGPAGLLSCAARLAALELEIRSAAAAYQAADHLVETGEPYLDALGSLPRGVGAAAAALDQLVGDLRSGRLDAVPGALADLQGTLTADPSLVAAVAKNLGGMPLIAALRAEFTASQLLSDGEPVVTRRAPEPDAPYLPPRNLAQIISGLERPIPGGDVDVHIMPSDAGRSSDEPGPRRVIVDIPGTDNWAPSSGNPDVANLGTNVLAIEGADTSYERGVIEAMRQAGIRADDDVMLVGHSQGGMVAVNTAHDLSRSGEFQVSHVVTAGSPIAGTVGELPANVRVLAIENDSDIVPMLDGAVNPDRPNVTTVTVTHRYDDIDASHALETAYVPGANDIDADGRRYPSVAEFLQGIHGFVSSESIVTQTFHIARGTE
ncbi:Lipase (class 3) [Frankineae bacterium MT45]|nr:Lipase (class 3) [Frankineae bacterium MT45]